LDADLSPRDLLRLLSEKFPPAEAFTAFSRYRERFGDEHDLYNNYAWLLATSPEASWRNPDTALRLARRAIELSPEPNAYYHGTLAAASAAAGDFDAARSNVQTALGLSSENPGLREELFAMQQLFGAGLPYVEHPMPATP
jgi:tetratricopeptide (TPR) repeat protein